MDLQEHKLSLDTREDWGTAKEWPGLGRKLRILVAPANKGGCSYYRAWSPFQKIQEQFPNLIDFKYNENPLEVSGTNEEQVEGANGYEDLHWCDVFFTQNLSNYGGPATIRGIGLAKEFGKFVWYDTDDLLTNIYDDHRLKKVYVDNDLENLTKYIYQNSDLVTVTQEKFAQRIAPFCTGTLAVIKNAVDYNLPAWNAPKLLSDKKNKVRVGWVGGIHHEADVKEFAGVPSMVNQKAGRERVQWGFYGRPPRDPNNKEDWQQDVWDNYEKTLLKGFKGAQNYNVYQALPTSEYGVMYSNIDLAIAPLQNNDFNDSKSDIKVAECGRYKVPLIASDVGCYSDTIINGQTGYLIPPDAPPSEWSKLLSNLIRNPKKIRQMGENLHAILEELFDLNKVVYHRLDILKFAMGRAK
jgi:glycosyltransferase involved in cell wall biosynthesis